MKREPLMTELGTFVGYCGYCNRTVSRRKYRTFYSCGKCQESSGHTQVQRYCHVLKKLDFIYGAEVVDVSLGLLLLEHKNKKLSTRHIIQMTFSVPHCIAVDEQLRS